MMRETGHHSRDDDRLALGPQKRIWNLSNLTNLSNGAETVLRRARVKAIEITLVKAMMDKPKESDMQFASRRMG